MRTRFRSFLTGVLAVVALLPWAGVYAQVGRLPGSNTIVSGTTTISGGGNTQVCFNSAGTLACGDADMIFSTDTLTVTKLSSPTILAGAVPMSFLTNTTAFRMQIAAASGTAYLGNPGTDGSEGVATSPAAGQLFGTSGSGTNIAGGNLAVGGGRATGNATSGLFTITTGVPGSSGTTVQTQADRISLQPGYKNLSAGSATAVVRIGVTQGPLRGDGGWISYTIEAADATDMIVRSGRLQWQVVNKAGTETCVIGDGTASEAEDGSAEAESVATSLTYTVDCVTAATDTVDIRFTAASGLTETTLRMKQGMVFRNGDSGTITWQ